jgi:hypothetical protein
MDIPRNLRTALQTENLLYDARDGAAKLGWLDVVSAIEDALTKVNEHFMAEEEHTLYSPEAEDRINEYEMWGRKGRPDWRAE